MSEQTIYNVFTSRMAREISAFGKWVREKRIEQGLSMRDLAERTGDLVSAQAIGGHTDKHMTQKYAHTTAARLRTSIESLTKKKPDSDTDSTKS